MTTLSDDAVSADELRARLLRQLCDDGAIRTGGVKTAFAQVPREAFLPSVPLEQAYADTPVYTKYDASGRSISAASQPGIVAMMLEQLDLSPGARVLEAGAGTGVNAAYMATVVGPDGHVITIDVDEDLVAGARAHLAAAGITNAQVLCADGALGHPDVAPYDRIIATVGAYEIPAAWLEQLAPGGRLVVPLRLRGAAYRCIGFERGDGGWHSVNDELAVFMPLRGIGDDAGRTVPLTLAGDVTLEVNKDQTIDDDALTIALGTERHEIWTGTLIAPAESFEWLELWLTCRLPGALMRMNVDKPAFERGTVARMFGWGAMATARGRDLAYLTIRSAPAGPDGEKRNEVGVIGHGPAGLQLAEHVAAEITRWDAGFRHRNVRFALPDAPATADVDTDRGHFLLHRPTRPIAVSWE